MAVADAEHGRLGLDRLAQPRRGAFAPRLARRDHRRPSRSPRPRAPSADRAAPRPRTRGTHARVSPAVRGRPRSTARSPGASAATPGTVVPVFTISTSDMPYALPQASLAGNVRGATARDRSCYNGSDERDRRRLREPPAARGDRRLRAVPATRVCSECSTKVEGINHCVTCLAGLAREGGRKVGAAAPQPRELGVRRGLGLPRAADALASGCCSSSCSREAA